MKTSDPYAEAYAQAARAAERCQYHTPTGRQCACLIQDQQSKFCPRHSESPSTDTQNFADLLAESAEDFQTAEGINRSLAQLFRLLAGGQISTRRATGLAYIASLLLRTLPAINGQLDLNKAMQYEIDVPPRGCVGMSPDEKPPTLPALPSPEEDDRPSLPSRTHPSQQSPAPQPSLPPAPQPQAPVTQSLTPPGAEKFNGRTQVHNSTANLHPTARRRLEERTWAEEKGAGYS